MVQTYIWYVISIGDSLSYHRGRPFSTQDNDHGFLKCAGRHHGGWWYNQCLKSNLNGKYMNGSSWSSIIWDSWKGKTSLKKTLMMVRPSNYKRGRNSCLVLIMTRFYLNSIALNIFQRFVIQFVFQLLLIVLKFKLVAPVCQDFTLFIQGAVH